MTGKSQLVMLTVTLSFWTAMSAGVLAGEATTADRLAWQVVSEVRDVSLVTFRALGEVQADAPWTYLVCHGLGGTSAGDRFERLCREIKAAQPQANVILLDWSDAARDKKAFITFPWVIAKRIDPVGRETSSQFQKLGLAPQKTTAIGESFGAYVLGTMARELGGIEHLLAMNPASELGGYTPPDLRKCARRAWSFHTYSAYDTLQDIAHGGLFLETTTGATQSQQHTHGVQWLAERLASQDSSWLKLEPTLPAAKAGAFHCEAGLGGELRDKVVARERPQPKTEPQPQFDVRLAEQPTVSTLAQSGQDSLEMQP